jgi:hypothetical protein
MPSDAKLGYSYAIMRFPVQLPTLRTWLLEMRFRCPATSCAMNAAQDDQSRGYDS